MYVLTVLDKGKLIDQKLATTEKILINYVETALVERVESWVRLNGAFKNYLYARAKNSGKQVTIEYIITELEILQW